MADTPEAPPSVLRELELCRIAVCIKADAMPRIKESLYTNGCKPITVAVADEQRFLFCTADVMAFSRHPFSREELQLKGPAKSVSVLQKMVEGTCYRCSGEDLAGLVVHLNFLIAEPLLNGVHRPRFQQFIWSLTGVVLRCLC